MTLRLDELFQELNDSKDQKQYLEKAIVAYPHFAFYVKEAFSYFDWVDFPIEDVRPAKIWEYHWSMAPNKALSKYAINSIEQVFKNSKMDPASRLRKFKYFLENLCTEESVVFFLVMTKNIKSKYPDINADVVFEMFPEIEYHAE